MDISWKFSSKENFMEIFMYSGSFGFAYSGQKFRVPNPPYVKEMPNPLTVRERNASLCT